MSVPFVRSPYNYDVDAASHAAGIAIDPEESVTQQHHAEEADINTIVRRFGLTGEMPSDFKMPQFGDFTAVGDFQSAMNMVRSAQESFDSLPAEVRRKFGNDPQLLMEFLGDARNRDQAVELGLVKPPEVTRDGVAAPVQGGA